MPITRIFLSPDKKYITFRLTGNGHINMKTTKVITRSLELADDDEPDTYDNLVDLTYDFMYTATFKSSLTITTGENFLDDDESMILSIITPTISMIEECKTDQIDDLKDIMKILMKLDIAAAPHIGVLTEGTGITITDRNSVSLTDFEDGEECVLIKHPNGNFTLTSGERCFVYHIPSLQGWLDAGNTSEPLTRVPITQAMLQRFKYSKPAGAAGAAAGAGEAAGGAAGASRKRKSRKSRKVRKTRRSRN